MAKLGIDTEGGASGKNIFAKFLYVSKWIMGIAAFVVFSISTYNGLNKTIQISNKTGQNEIKAYIKLSMDSTAHQYRSLSRKIDHVASKQEDIIDSQNRLRKVVVDQAASDKTITKEDLREIIEGVGAELKKNDFSYNPYDIPSMLVDKRQE